QNVTRKLVVPGSIFERDLELPDTRRVTDDFDQQRQVHARALDLGEILVRATDRRIKTGKCVTAMGAALPAHSTLDQISRPVPDQYRSAPANMAEYQHARLAGTHRLVRFRMQQLTEEIL